MRWFKSFGLVYLPVSVMGWAATLLMAAFAAQVFLFIDSRSHSVSDTLYGVFPYWVPTFLLWAWLAGRTSTERGRSA
ncbi:MAG: hypothetical protein JSR45_10020 [Proteobacteria bacterium]|nr:hypothetical protein [Pseudomonadota bacterium]